MIADHNFEVGTVLASNAETWEVREPTFWEKSTGRTGVPVTNCRSHYRTLLGLHDIQYVVNVPAPKAPHASTDDGGAAHTVEFNLAVLRVAKEFGRQVVFCYRNLKGERGAHTVTVEKLVDSALAGSTYFSGPDEMHDGEYRNFRVKSIEGEIELY